MILSVCCVDDTAQREARQANHEQVVEEDRRSKLPKNFDARKRKAEYEADYEKRKKVDLMILGCKVLYFS